MRTPWNDETVARLNEHQSDGRFHPYTCGGDRMDDAHRAYQSRYGGDFGQLVATRDGWFCPACDYRQTWAHPLPSPPPVKE